MHLFYTVTKCLKEADDDDKVVSPLQVACVLVDWTDPQKVMYVNSYMMRGTHFYGLV